MGWLFAVGLLAGVGVCGLALGIGARRSVILLLLMPVSRLRGMTLWRVLLAVLLLRWSAIRTLLRRIRAMSPVMSSLLRVLRLLAILWLLGSSAVGRLLRMTRLATTVLGLLGVLRLAVAAVGLLGAVVVLVRHCCVCWKDDDDDDDSQTKIVG